MTRIAIAGFQHETNSFGVGEAGLAEFEMADSWPGLLSGPEVISGTRGMNLPIAGFIAAAEQGGAGLSPILWCAAEPSGPVTDEAFETIAGRICEGLRKGPWDAIYLDLHGAMITQSHDDGEGELLGRIRGIVGPDLPIVLSLDMHANVSEEMVDLSDTICVFRTYPHLDMARTGARCWTRLQHLLRGFRLSKAFRRGPNPIPLHAQNTGAEPARSLYAGLDDDVELALGFTAADIPEALPSLIAYQQTQRQADEFADQLLGDLCAATAEFQTALSTPQEAMARVKDAPRGKPVVLADVQDNPGAGASSDTTGVLRALVEEGARDAMVGLMHDPELARKAHGAGVGAVIKGQLGGRSGLPDDAPFEGHFRVLSLSAGDVSYSGEMYGGGLCTLGLSCALELISRQTKITVVVTSIRNQCLDLAQFRHFGLEPADAQVVVVKSTAHFRADFEPIASEVISVDAPGLFPCTAPFRLPHLP